MYIVIIKTHRIVSHCNFGPVGSRNSAVAAQLLMSMSSLESDQAGSTYLISSSSSFLQTCKICEKRFANVYRLQRHMISHDESAVLRRFKCPDCGKAFKFKHHLKVKTEKRANIVTRPKFTYDKNVLCVH